MELFEVLRWKINSLMVIEERPINEFRDYAVEHGHMRTLRHDGVKKVTSG